MSHEHGESCPRCEKMLEQADERISAWFKEHVKPAFREAHISCAYRGEADQNRAFEEGKSKLKWPKSSHNATDSEGKPRSRALDLFWLSNDGRQALFPLPWYKQIFAQSVDGATEIRWGGHFKTLGDSNHFELA